jgi:hypothetical protein
MDDAGVEDGREFIVSAGIMAVESSLPSRPSASAAAAKAFEILVRRLDWLRVIGGMVSR